MLIAAAALVPQSGTATPAGSGSHLRDAVRRGFGPCSWGTGTHRARAGRSSRHRHRPDRDKRCSPPPPPADCTRPASAPRPHRLIARPARRSNRVRSAPFRRSDLSEVENSWNLASTGSTRFATHAPGRTARLARLAEDLGDRSWWAGDHVVLPRRRHRPGHLALPERRLRGDQQHARSVRYPVQAQKRVGGPAGIGSGSGASSATRARTSSWNRRASSSAATLCGRMDEHAGTAPRAASRPPCRARAAIPRRYVPRRPGRCTGRRDRKSGPVTGGAGAASSTAPPVRRRSSEGCRTGRWCRRSPIRRRRHREPSRAAVPTGGPERTRGAAPRRSTGTRPGDGAGNRSARRVRRG